MEAVDPRFPPELERVIFEIAAVSHSPTIPDLLLVAWRVKNWVEPLLYRFVIVFSPWPAENHSVAQNFGFPVCPVDVLLRVIQTKPTEFFRNSVKHLLLDGDAPQKEEMEAILSACTQVTNLCVYSSRIFTRGLRPLPDFQCLRRLAITANDFTQVTADHTALVSTLTHLDLFCIHTYLHDDPDASEIVAFIGRAVDLTHVAFDDPVPNALYTALCSHPRIQCIVYLDLDSYGLNEVTVSPLARDDRSVCIEEQPSFPEDWLLGTDGGRDFWARAESFIAARRAGKVDRAQYNIDKSWGI